MTELGLSKPGDTTLPAKDCIRPPKGDVCVIFIHGILSGSESAWTSDNGISWPRLLEDEPEFVDAGIFLFSYRADLNSKTYTIDNAAESLREFIRFHKLLEKRRLVFVAHSMGGIVTRRYLVANQVDLIDCRVIIGLLLIASPSLGSEDANTLCWINQRLLCNTQLDTLQFSEGNTWLNTLDQDFRNLKDGGWLSIVGKELVEDETITLKKFLLRSDPIVKDFSASRYFPYSVKIEYSDHMSICKPAGRTAQQHEVLIAFLRQVLNAGPSARTHAEAEQAQKDDLIAVLRYRAQDYVNQLDKVVAKLTAEAGTKPDETHTAIARLIGLRAEFLELYEKHVAAVAESNLLAAQDTNGEIYELRAEVMQVVAAASSRISVEMGRGLSRRYADIPEPGTDPEYDEVLRERLVLHGETTERVRAMSYPGDTPAGVTRETARLAFDRGAQRNGTLA